MTNTYWYGNRQPVQHKKVSVFNGLIEFDFHNEDESSAFATQIDKGLIIRVQNDHGSQEIKFARDDFNVIPCSWGVRQYLKFTRNGIDNHVESLISGEFIHICSNDAIGLASELSSTMLHMIISSATSRKSIRVYHKTPVADFAHVVLKAIGLGRIRPNLTRNEFHREFTPERAEQVLISVIKNHDLHVQFIPHDGKKRPLYCSLFGEGVIEFAEQGNG